MPREGLWSRDRVSGDEKSRDRDPRRWGDGVGEWRASATKPMKRAEERNLSNEERVGEEERKRGRREIRTKKGVWAPRVRGASVDACESSCPSRSDPRNRGERV